MDATESVETETRDEAGDAEGYEALREEEEELYLPLSSGDSPAPSDSFLAAMSSASSRGLDSPASRHSDASLRIGAETPPLPTQRSDTALASLMLRTQSSTSGSRSYTSDPLLELHDDTSSHGRSLFERVSRSIHFSKPSDNHHYTFSPEEPSSKAVKGTAEHHGMGWILSRQKNGPDNLSYSEHDGRAIAALQLTQFDNTHSQVSGGEIPIFHRIKSGIGLRRKGSTRQKDTLSYSEHDGIHVQEQSYAPPAPMRRDSSNSSLVDMMRSRMSDARINFSRSLHDALEQESSASTQADSERGIGRVSSSVLQAAKKRLCKNGIHTTREGSTSNLLQKLKSRFSDAGNVISAGVKNHSELHNRKSGSLNTYGSDRSPSIAEDKAKVFWTALSSKLKKKRAVANPMGQLKKALEERTRSKADLHKMWLIHPKRNFKLRWDTFFGILIIITTAYIPFKIAFENEVNPRFDFGFEIFVVLFFCADIILTFNTAVFNELTGLLITDRREIARRYLKFWFWIDILSSFPFDLIVSAVDENSSDVSYFPLFRLLRYAKVLIHCILHRTLILSIM